MDEGDASEVARERAPPRAGAGRRPDPPVGAGLFAAGGILGALAAASCCIVPLVLFGAGVSTAWIGNLGALAPYQPAFFALTLLFLAGGFWSVYRRPPIAAAEGSTCAAVVPRGVVKAALWGASALVAAAIAFPFVAPTLLGV